MPTRNSGSADQETSGFTEDQRSELAAMIAEAIGSAKPPPGAGTVTAGSDGPRRVSDGEWDAMSDRQREGWVRQLVDFRLEELARDDEQRRIADDVEKLKADKTPQPEAPPSVVTKLQRWLWGEPDT